MPRSLTEWIGRTDTKVPDRVRLRVLDRYGRRCDASAHGCGRMINPGDAWTCDHLIPLIAGEGLNRESNLHPLCDWCNPEKNKLDMSEKSAVYKTRLRHAGIKREAVGRPLPGTYASGIKLPMRGGPVWRDSGRPLGQRR